MTPIALIYFILGLSALYWPFVTLFFKRRVLGAQWLIMSALMSMGLAVIIYSTFFNNFLKGEYILVIMFMILSMFTPPLIQAAVTNLTDTGEKRPLLSRLNVLVIPAVVLAILLAASVIIGGSDMYRLWIQRGSEGIAHHFYAGSWRYNLIVAVHFYLYWFLIVAETTFVGAYSIIRINRFSRLLDDYYSVNRVNRADLQGTYLFVALNCFFVVLSYVMYPFNSPRPILGTAFGCTLQAVVMFFIGYFSKKDISLGLYFLIGLLSMALLVLFFWWIIAAINGGWQTIRTIDIVYSVIVCVIMLLFIVIDGIRVRQIASNGAQSNNVYLYCAYIMYSDFITLLIRVIYILARTQRN